MTKLNKNNNKLIKFKKFICNRCGRDDFINGHALGGHKKYCQKPEYYDKSYIKKRKKKNNKKTKRKRNKKNVPKIWNKDLEMDLGQIIYSINNLFGINFTKNTKKQEKELEKKLSKILNSKDFEDILIIRHFLNSSKDNLENQIEFINKV